jgi:hypothetical protein
MVMQVSPETGLPVPYFMPNVAAIKFRSLRGSQGAEELTDMDFEEYDQETNTKQTKSLK